MANLQTHAAGSSAEQAALISFSVRLPGLALLLTSGLLLRLGLAFLPGFGVDMGTFMAWSNQLATEHPWNFYNETSFTDYAPGYMYVLWVIGEAHQKFNFTNDQYEYILKMPAIVADIASAYLMYRILDREKPAVRLGAVAIYVFFPPALLIGAMWGQVDSILAFFLLLTVYYIARDKPVHGAVAYTIGFLIKPQAIAALPFLAFWIIRDHYKDTRTIALCATVPLVILLILITPFFEAEPWRLYTVLRDATDVQNYRVNSFWAYNFWNFGGLFEQGFKCDLPGSCGDNQGTRWLGVATRYWGWALFAAGITLVVASLRNARGTGYLALGVALSVMVFYLFLTRMHERYLFAAFLPFLLAAVIINSRLIWATFTVLAVAHLANLYHVFGYYYPNNTPGDNLPSIRYEWAFDWLEKPDLFGADLPLFGRLETVQFASMVMVAAFLLLLFGNWLRLEQKRAEAEVT